MRKSLILLGILDDSDIEWTLRVGTRQKVTQGTTLIREKEPLDSVYIVLEGSFAVSVGSTNNKVARLYSGEILGEMSFLDSRPPSATVTAEEDSWVLEIPRVEVRMRMEEEVAFAARFYRALAVFLTTRLRETVSNLGYGQAKAIDDDDPSQLPEDLLDNMAIAGKRFTVLQGRSRGASV
jgi:CRP/FNR family transcriptional regulator, cyclic AMP receptor protein